MSCSSLQHGKQYDHQAMTPQGAQTSGRTHSFVVENFISKGTPAPIGVSGGDVLRSGAPTFMEGLRSGAPTFTEGQCVFGTSQMNNINAELMPNTDMGNFADLQTAYSYTPTMSEFKNKIMQNNNFFQTEKTLPDLGSGAMLRSSNRSGAPDLGSGAMHLSSNLSRAPGINKFQNNMDGSQNPNIDFAKQKSTWENVSVINSGEMKPDVLEINTNLNNLLSRHNNTNNIPEGTLSTDVHSQGMNSLVPDKIDDIISSIYNNQPPQIIYRDDPKNNDNLYNIQVALERKSGMTMLRLIIWIALIVAILYGIYYIYDAYDSDDAIAENVSNFIVTLPTKKYNLDSLNSI